MVTLSNTCLGCLMVMERRAQLRASLLVTRQVHACTPTEVHPYCSAAGFYSFCYFYCYSCCCFAPCTNNVALPTVVAFLAVLHALQRPSHQPCYARNTCRQPGTAQPAVISSLCHQSCPSVSPSHGDHQPTVPQVGAKHCAASV
jgi:hypothetical protein